MLLFLYLSSLCMPYTDNIDNNVWKRKEGRTGKKGRWQWKALLSILGMNLPGIEFVCDWIYLGSSLLEWNLEGMNLPGVNVPVKLTNTLQLECSPLCQCVLLFSPSCTGVSKARTFLFHHYDRGCAFTNMTVDFFHHYDWGCIHQYDSGETFHQNGWGVCPRLFFHHCDSAPHLGTIGIRTNPIGSTRQYIIHLIYHPFCSSFFFLWCPQDTHESTLSMLHNLLLLQYLPCIKILNLIGRI